MIGMTGRIKVDGLTIGTFSGVAYTQPGCSARSVEAVEFVPGQSGPFTVSVTRCIRFNWVGLLRVFVDRDFPLPKRKRRREKLAKQLWRKFAEEELPVNTFEKSRTTQDVEK